MKLEDVTQAVEQAKPVIHTHMNIKSHCRISGVISRYCKNKWTYSLELIDDKSGCVIIAALDSVQLTVDS